MIAITLIAGAAVFGFINGQTGSSAQAVGNSAAANINFLNERESIVYGGVNATGVKLWVYNSGSINPLTITNINIFSGSTKVAGCTWTFSPVPTQKVVEFPTSNSCVLAKGSYTFQVIGYYKSSAQINLQV